MTRRRRALFGAVVLVGALCALELGARVVLRRLVATELRSPAMRAFAEEPNLVFDAELGWRPATGHMMQGVDNGLWFIERLPHHKPAGRTRGFALGDSQTLGAGLRAEEAWPKVTERALQADGLDVELINAAAAGYRSSQVLRLLETRLLAWDIDFVIVDCPVRDSPALPRHFGGPLTTLRGWLFYSRLYRLLWLGVAYGRDEDLGPVGEIAQEHPAGVAQEGNHAAILRLGEARGFKVYFLYYPVAAKPVRSLAPAEHLPEGAQALDTTSALLASGLDAKALFLHNNHMSVEGARIAGEAVATQLAAELAR